MTNNTASLVLGLLITGTVLVLAFMIGESDEI